MTKFRHTWLGPCRVKEKAGFDNFKTERLDNGEQILVHESLLWPYSTPWTHLDEVALDAAREVELDDRDSARGRYGADVDGECDSTERQLGPAMARYLESSSVSSLGVSEVATSARESGSDTPAPARSAPSDPARRDSETGENDAEPGTGSFEDDVTAAAPTVAAASEDEAIVSAAAIEGAGTSAAEAVAQQTNRSESGASAARCARSRQPPPLHMSLRSRTRAGTKSDTAAVLVTTASQERARRGVQEEDQTRTLLRLTRSGVFFVERRRRRRRNRIGQYALEIEPCGATLKTSGTTS
ncbi:hypothetical protein ATCC90586_001525 [Pythium insidiosum]|nr:hypothetical protein ATCC90586_001525 [Pythium insidiosum]